MFAFTWAGVEFFDELREIAAVRRRGSDRGSVGLESIGGDLESLLGGRGPPGTGIWRRSDRPWPPGQPGAITESDHPIFAGQAGICVWTEIPAPIAEISSAPVWPARSPPAPPSRPNRESSSPATRPWLRPPAPGPRLAPDSARLLKVLDRAVQAIYDADSPIEAWKRIARPSEVVGLKVNCLSGRGDSTSTVLVEAVCERLQQAGIPHTNIVIWDRLNSDLESAGFQVSSRKDRIRCIGNDASGYETDLAIYGSVGSLLSNTLTRTCDAVVNLPVLKDHGIVGVTMALKNLFGAIHNPNKYHLTAGDPYVADVNMLPPIRQKVRLTICDAIAPQYEGGPSYMPQWSWPFNGVIASRDPVALDYTGGGSSNRNAPKRASSRCGRSSANRPTSPGRPMPSTSSEPTTPT